MNNRFRLLVMLLGAVLVAATFTFPYWQPLFQRQQEAAPVEVLSGLSPELQPTFEALPGAQRNGYRQLAAQNPDAAVTMITAALQPPTVVPEADQALPSMSGPEDVFSGRFGRIDDIRWAEGEVTVYQQADQNKVVRFENFTMVGGPDLRVVLSAIPDATAAAAATALGGSDIDLGPLQGNVGAQNYELTGQIDLARYNSIVIYSASLRMIYSIAPLTPT